MEELDTTFTDWHTCGPDGVVLRADRLGTVVAKVAARSAVAGRGRVQELLAPPKNGGLPPFVRLLRVDGQRRLGAGVGRANEGTAVIHFMCFWQAVDEVNQRFQCPEIAEDMEPFASEAVEFRDAILAACEAGGLTHAALRAKVASAQRRSSDPSAWRELVGACSGLSDGTGPSESPCEAAMPMETLSSLCFLWLPELVEDYLRGGRSVGIRCVKDVLGCSVREACIKLGASSWDVEGALRRFYAGSSPHAAIGANSDESWGSQSAKLCSSTPQCPICCANFGKDTRSILLQCCFQVICEGCAAAVTDTEGVLRCPFCRCLDVRPLPRRRTDRVGSVYHTDSGVHIVDGSGGLRGRELEACARGSDVVNSALSVAGKYAEDAGRGLRCLLERAWASQDWDAEVSEVRADLRFDVVFR